MTENDNEGRVSLLGLGTTLLRNRWRIARWTLLGGVLAAALVFARRPEYSAIAAFTPVGSETGRTGLASLAGQFGISIPASGDMSKSPDFYVQLITSRAQLLPIVRDTFVVPESGGRRIAFLDLFEIGGRDTKVREEHGLTFLSKKVVTSASRNTGVVSVSIATRWPSVSLAIVTKLIDAVNAFNLGTRQTQAASERKFVSGQLTLARDELRAAEDRLQTFRRNNRQIANSPELSLQDERLQRQVLFQQQVVTTLMQSFEEAKIREVRDTPMITVIQAPAVRGLPEPRKRLQRGMLGLLGGALFGVILVIGSEELARRRSVGDPEASEFVATVRAAAAGPLRVYSALPARFRR